MLDGKLSLTFPEALSPASLPVPVIQHKSVPSFSSNGDRHTFRAIILLDWGRAGTNFLPEPIAAPKRVQLGEE